MHITIDQLRRVHFIEKALINSFEMSLYSLSVVIAGEEYTVVNKQGAPLRSHHKIHLQQILEPLSVKQVLLRHNSAYDEMIGQPIRETDNTLQVPLGNPNNLSPEDSIEDPLH